MSGWIVEVERELGWISLNSLWVEWRVGWSVGVRLIGEVG